MMMAGRGPLVQSPCRRPVSRLVLGETFSFSLGPKFPGADFCVFRERARVKN